MANAWAEPIAERMAELLAKRETQGRTYKAWPCGQGLAMVLVSKDGGQHSEPFWESGPFGVANEALEQLVEA